MTSTVTNGEAMVAQRTSIDFCLLPGQPAAIRFNDEQLVNGLVSMTHGDVRLLYLARASLKALVHVLACTVYTVLKCQRDG